MFNGQWFGKYEGSWGGSVTESPIGSMFGVSTFVFVAAGSLTVKTDSWLPIDANYYPYVTASGFTTTSISDGYDSFLVDYSYHEYLVDSDYNASYINGLYSKLSIDPLYSTIGIDSNYSSLAIDSGYNIWQLS